MNFKFSNRNIPVCEKNNPKILTTPNPNRATSKKFACRDPYILLYGDKYYFYQGAGSNGIICSVSDDLETWSDAVTVFKVPENFHGVKHMFWAPECHYFNGYFYIFTSVFSGKYNHRTISVYRADNPLGPFEDIADGCITPKDWDAIDGTLYVDEDGKPWMVFVHEWTSMPDHNGGMCCAQLSDDFTHFVSEPQHLFYARDPKWAKNGVTDGCYMYKNEDGTLLMIWSNMTEKGYVVGLVKSETGKVTGPWTHYEELVYEKGLKPEFKEEGGHAMIFETKEGKIVMALHTPNRKTPEGDYEHLDFLNVIEKEGRIEVEY